MNKIGVIGLGIMGGAIARNLMAAGFSVSGFDIDKDRTQAAASSGAAAHGSAVGAAEGVDLVLTSLLSIAALDATVEALAATRRPGLILAELSTLPIEAKERARDRLAGAGIVALDCPLSGTGAQAVTRELALYGSGDEAGFSRCRDAFAGFAAAEAIVLGTKAGLDPERILEVISSGAGTSRIFELRGPMMAKGVYTPPTATMRVLQKDSAII